MTLEFTIPRPLSLNRMYAPRRGGHGKQLYMTADGKAFKARIGCVGFEARQGSDWPRNLWRIRRAEIAFQLYDYRGDVDGPRKAVRDALEGILYINDRLVQDGPAPLPIKDGKGSRMVVTVTILELIDDAAATALRVKYEKAKRRRETRKQKRAAA